MGLRHSLSRRRVSPQTRPSSRRQELAKEPAVARSRRISLLGRPSTAPSRTQGHREVASEAMAQIREIRSRNRSL
jgi:hypothetical protein